MKARTLAALLLAGSTMSARAASYNDLNIGIFYFTQGDLNNAIAWFDKVIAAGDLNPDLMRVAHLDRGKAHLYRGEVDAAITDYAAAGRLEVAVSDLGKIALRTFPENPRIFFESGLLNWQLRRYEDALKDFSRGGSDATSWLWQQLANVRLGKPVSPYGKDLVDEKIWPNPLVAFYLGKSDVQAVLTSAQQSQGPEACEAAFFVGQWHLAHGDTIAGKPLMQKAASDCRSDPSKLRISKFELEKIPEGAAR